MTKKLNKKHAAIAAGAVVVAAAAVGGAAYAMSGPKLALKKNAVNVEYGRQYEPSLKDLVKDYKDFDKKSLKLINKIPNEKDKTYPAVGKYTITVKYKKKSVKQTVTVKDTKAPEVTLPTNIEILQGTDVKTFDFNSLVTVSDPSETTITVDSSKVDTNTPSQYDITVTVKDKYGNKTKKTGKVTVTAKPEISDDEQVVQETVKNSDGTTTVRNSVQKKTQSSGKKVVSNSSNVTRKASTSTSAGTSSNRSSSSSSSTTRRSSTSGSRSQSSSSSSANRNTTTNRGTTNRGTTNNRGTSGSKNSSSGSSNSSSGSHKGSMTFKTDPKSHYETKDGWSEGGDIKGEDFDKLTGGDWKDFN